MTYRAKIRMYKQGLGDCFLITLPRKGDVAGDYFILIDCGVILGTPNAPQIMSGVMKDILDTTNARVDLLVATHEHWDHLSGFVQAKDLFRNLTAGEVWMAWTEDPDDALGEKLSGERAANINALRMSVGHLAMAGEVAQAENVASLLDFFGAARGPSTRDALEAVRSKSAKPRYCRPDDPPVDIEKTGARIYVLGPPRDEKLIRKTSPSASSPQTYQLGADAFATDAIPALQAEVAESPFGPVYAIPWIVAQETEFFRDRYFSADSWRRIDGAWLNEATAMALALDNATNNTSLVLAIELPPGDGNNNRDVLLFAADAQVGNWLSWKDLKWAVGEEAVTGPELLQRTVMYKVGHHGSHNATLKEHGLETMANLKYALLPVNEVTAKKKHWGRMPLPSLVDALLEHAHDGVVRSDASLPTGITNVTENQLWFELTL